MNPLARVLRTTAGKLGRTLFNRLARAEMLLNVTKLLFVGDRLVCLTLVVWFPTDTLFCREYK